MAETAQQACPALLWRLINHWPATLVYGVTLQCIPYPPTSSISRLTRAVHNGNILTYLRNSKWTSKERRTQTLSLIYEVAQGMEYLHARDIIHGDFKVRPPCA